MKSLTTRLKEYFWNILVALDQLLNTMFSGYPDETFSARIHRKAEAGQWFWRVLRRVVDRVFFWQEGHCRASYENELRRAHSPREAQHV